MKVFVVICFKVIGREHIFVNAAVFKNSNDASTFGANYDDSIVIERTVS